MSQKDPKRSLKPGHRSRAAQVQIVTLGNLVQEDREAMARRLPLDFRLISSWFLA